jgi:hypothetical protein
MDVAIAQPLLREPDHAVLATWLVAGWAPTHVAGDRRRPAGHSCALALRCATL